MTAWKLSLIAVAAFYFSGCASSHVLVGNARASIEEDAVKIYVEPPAQYETVALLEASDLGANGFSAQSRMNKVIGRLKAEAAELGANGVLLQGFDTRYTGSVGSGFANAAASGNSAFVSGMRVSSATYSKVGRAVAIYVPAQVTATPANSVEVEQPILPVPARVPAAADPQPRTVPNGKPADDSAWRSWGSKGD